MAFIQYGYVDYGEQGVKKSYLHLCMDVLHKALYLLQPFSIIYYRIFRWQQFANTDPIHNSINETDCNTHGTL